MKILFGLFFILPLAEIYFLIRVGALVGSGTTILLVVLTALLGACLVRLQGLSTVERVRSRMAAGQLPALELIEGLLLFIAGALLLTPGFFTDACGFMLLIPPLRRRLIRSYLHHGGWRSAGQADYSAAFVSLGSPPPPPPPTKRGRVIDIEEIE